MNTNLSLHTYIPSTLREGVISGGVKALVAFGGIIASVSTYLEALVFTSFIGPAAIALIIALEGMKVCAIFFGIILLSRWGKVKYHLLRWTLILISLVSTNTLIITTLDGLSIEEIRQVDTARTADLFDQQREQIIADYQPQIELLNAKILEEMDNVASDGSFKGPRYLEFQERLREVQQQKRGELEALEDERLHRVEEIATTASFDDPRAGNTFIESTGHLLGFDLAYRTIGLLLSFMVSLAMELAIMWGFGILGAMLLHTPKKDEQEAEDASDTAISEPAISGDGVTASPVDPVIKSNGQAISQHADASMTKEAEIERELVALERDLEQDRAEVADLTVRADNHDQIKSRAVALQAAFNTKKKKLRALEAQAAAYPALGNRLDRLRRHIIALEGNVYDKYEAALNIPETTNAETTRGTQ